MFYCPEGLVAKYVKEALELPIEARRWKLVVVEYPVRAQASSVESPPHSSTAAAFSPRSVRRIFWYRAAQARGKRRCLMEPAPISALYAGGAWWSGRGGLDRRGILSLTISRRIHKQRRDQLCRVASTRSWTMFGQHYAEMG